MKTKIPFLIAAGLFLATASMAQYGTLNPDSRVVIQGQVVIPGHAVVAYGYNNLPPVRYEENYDRREDDCGRHEDRRNQRHYGYERYDDQLDWRAAEYERYSHDHRDFRMSREDFYRDQCEYRGNHHNHNKKVIVYSN